MQGERHSLLIATDTYEDPALAGLRAPAGDATALASLLADPEIGSFAAPTVLLNRSNAEITQALETFFDSARRLDLLLLYVSGHGVISKDGRLFFATRETKLDRLKSTGIGEVFINDVMEHSRAQSIVLILDCCHSGAFSRGLVPKSAPGVAADRRFTGQGRVVLTASNALEYAFEEASTGVHETSDQGSLAPGSLFTRCLVEGLRTGEADGDGDGKITLDELYSYLYRQVREISPHQTPGRSGTGYGEILIATNPASLTAALPADLLSMISSPSADTRVGAINWLTDLLSATDSWQARAARAAIEKLRDDDSRRVSDRARQALGERVSAGDSRDATPNPVVPAPTVVKLAAPDPPPDQPAARLDAASPAGGGPGLLSTWRGRSLLTVLASWTVFMAALTWPALYYGHDQMSPNIHKSLLTMSDPSRATVKPATFVGLTCLACIVLLSVVIQWRAPKRGRAASIRVAAVGLTASIGIIIWSFVLYSGLYDDYGASYWHTGFWVSIAAAFAMVGTTGQAVWSASGRPSA